METGSLVTGVDDTERLRCGVWVPFGVSGGDDIAISSCRSGSDSDEWTSSALR